MEKEETRLKKGPGSTSDLLESVLTNWDSNKSLKPEIKSPNPSKTKKREVTFHSDFKNMKICTDNITKPSKKDQFRNNLNAATLWYTHYSEKNKNGYAIINKSTNQAMYPVNPDSTHDMIYTQDYSPENCYTWNFYDVNDHLIKSNAVGSLQKCSYIR